MNKKETWYQKLHRKRRLYNVSQEKIASLVGISRPYLSEIENGKAIPSPSLQEAIENVVEQCNPESPMELLFDYVRIRYPTIHVKHIIEDVLKLKQKYMLHEDYGYYGYSSHYRIGDVVVMSSLDQEKGTLLELKGRGCRQMESYLLGQGRSWYDFFQSSIEEDCAFKRIDLAINDKTGILDIPELADKCQKEECISVFRSFKHYRSGEFLRKDEKDHMGNTLYIGSFNSELYFCLYQKDIEQEVKSGIPVDESDVKNRFEIRLKNERAKNAVRDLILYRDAERTAFTIINRYLRFVDKLDNTERENWKLNPNWLHFIGEQRGQLRLSSKPQKYSIERTCHWLRKQSAPSLKLVLKLDELMGTGIGQSMIENAKLSPRQEKILIQLALPLEELIIQEKEENI